MLKGNASVVEVDVPSLATFNYQLNTTLAPFDKKKLRLAVAYALDVEAIVKGVWLNVGGAVITEYVFALPGVGRLVVDAVFSRDYPVVQGVILLIAIGFVLSNLVVDVIYGWLDPRIRYG